MRGRLFLADRERLPDVEEAEEREADEERDGVVLVEEVDESGRIISRHCGQSRGGKSNTVSGRLSEVTSIQ